MAMANRDLIRASEIADWCFCRRSWYLSARGVGQSLVQIEKRHAGIEYHRQHARSVNQARGIMDRATTRFSLPWCLLSPIGFGRTVAEMDRRRCSSCFALIAAALVWLLGSGLFARTGLPTRRHSLRGRR